MALKAVRAISPFSAAVTLADARQRRADRDRRVLDALRLGGSAEVIAAAVGVSPHLVSRIAFEAVSPHLVSRIAFEAVSPHLVRRIAFEARKNGQPDAVPARRLYRRAKQ